jgi:site-specific recombinase XerD
MLGLAEHLADLASSFRRHLRAEGNAERTGVVYDQAIHNYCEWLTARDHPATLDELTRTAITTWLADLVEAGRAPGTIRTRWKGLNRFCGWLVAEGVLDEHPMAGLAVPKVPERPVPLLSDDELAALIRACAGGGTTAATRP